MPHSDFKDKTDEYLLGRLSEEAAERFERHYFECPECFKETTERAALIDAVKAAGPAPVAERRPAGNRGIRRSWLGWAAAGVAVLLLAAAAILFLPQSSRPPDFPDGGIRSVRGDGLEIIGPAGTSAELPKDLAWKAIEGAAEYSVIVEGIDPVWTAETRDASISIPAEVSARLIPGRTYFWRVKAYAAEGTLVASSARTAFTFGR